VIIFDGILEGWEVDNEQGVLDYARGMVWSEIETNEQEISHKRYIGTVDGIGVYYDYGADYYFFTDETIK
jgi:hypothetical protein